MGVKVDVLVPLIWYFLIIYVIGFYSLRYVSQARSREGKGFLVEFLTGDRNLGGFVLAMTLVATYLSAGSFIGGPGAAYTHGLAWVFLAMSQMPTGYFTLAVVGKKLAIISRKINAVTITDLLKERYESKLVVVLCSIAIIFFFTAAMTAQWIGAARLLEGAVGVPYLTALRFFAISVLIYTTIGGFRAVALTDTLQGVVMTLGTAAVILAAVAAGGGVESLVQSLAVIDPGLISPYGPNPGFTTMAWVTSFWILVGFGVVGMPQVATRAMSYRDTGSLKRGIIFGTVVSMVLLLGMHLLGVFGRVLTPGIASGDLVVPTVITQLFPNWVAGLILAGPLAAVMSTVDSQLLLAVGAIVNDLYANLINPAIKRTAAFAFACTLAIGLVIYFWALNPPDLMVWLNLYAHAGIIATFLWPLILGIYWKEANAPGALASIVTGVGTYIWFNTDWIWPYGWARPFGLHIIVLPLVISLAAFVIVSRLTRKPSPEIIAKFWGI